VIDVRKGDDLDISTIPFVVVGISRILKEKTNSRKLKRTLSFLTGHATIMLYNY
jgi:hypothetical protein